MEAKSKTEGNSVFLKAAEQLLAVQQEIDELALQFALGKVEGKEKFEIVKSQFKTRMNQFRKILKSEISLPRELSTRIEELEIQLALGAAETRERLDEQKERILNALVAVEREFKSWVQGGVIDVNDELESLKLRLEILRLKFTVHKFELNEEFKDHMGNARREIYKIAASVREQLGSGKEKYNDFRDEITLAYKHLKKAIDAL